MKIAAILLTVATGAAAAPLFPEVKSDHWASQAVHKLAAHGLLDGYPDGTFKGDRTASRYEMALLVARLWQQYEQNRATWATKEDLDLLRKLTAELRNELEALGVRVTQIEQQTSLIDQRVEELERLTWSGSIEARATSQTFTNDGASDNDNQRGGAGLRAGVPFVDYNRVVGASNGATMRPQNQAAIPVVDYRNGRALTNGVGFTSLARLNLKIRIDKDNVAGVDLAAFTSQGSTPIDTYWGVSAPYLANAFTANGVATGGLQSQLNSPYSRAVLDRLWYEHKPSKTRLAVGSFDPLRMDSFIYSGQPNLGVYGPARFPGFGFQIQGQWDLAPDQLLKYEAFATRFGDGNLYQGTNYSHLVMGADVSYQVGNADLKLNYARYYDESPDSAGPLEGLNASGTNVGYLNSAGWTPVQWVNPNGHLAQQRTIFEQARTGAVNGTLVPNQFDTRPIAGWNGSADNALGITSGGGNFGSQAQTTLGLSAHYWLPLVEAPGKDGIRFTGEYAHSNYQSNRNSSYSRGGSLTRLAVDSTLLEGNLTLGLQYQRVDPSYNPSLFPGNQLGIRLVRPFNMTGRFHLHDNVNYPHNREGFLLKGNYWWDEKHANVGLYYGADKQTQTSLYDVRILGGSLGPAIPTNNVLGFSPGFLDPVFSGFASPNIYGAQSRNSFDGNLQPLENPRGATQQWGFNFKYRWDEPAVQVECAWDHNAFVRNSALPATLGGSQNQVDLKTDYLRLGTSWGFQQDWTLRGGCEWVHLYGHHDPAGLYNGFALSSGQTNFSNLDSLQTVPYVGLDAQLSKNTSWSVDFRYYTTSDRVDTAIYAGSGLNAIGATAHPFSWSGPQISTCYKLTF
ncbi:S-layer homology domain-containing protein [bacterium]|nr:S-layer homology domain-containing protein [bacterium]